MAGPARSTLDAAIATAHARGETWWLPEVQRMRARFDDPDQRAARLDDAVRLATEQGSVALVQRCRRRPRAASGPGLTAFAAYGPGERRARTLGERTPS